MPLRPPFPNAALRARAERNAARQSTGFLIAYGLANAGGVIAFLPFLTLLLPLKIEAIAGPDRLELLTVAAIAGALAASVANVLFGWLSDVTRAHGIGRRWWVAGGLVATAASFAAIALSASPHAIVLGVDATTAPLLLVGHSHIPIALQLSEDDKIAGGLARGGSEVSLGGGRLLLNPGSVGQPRDGDPRAAYLVIDQEKGTARFRRLPYPIEQTQAEIRELGLPETLAARLAEGE